MASDASAALGAPQLAGSFVNPKGYARRVTASVAGGLVGAAIAGATVGRPAPGDAPDFGRVGYVAVSADEVAVVKTKVGLWAMKVTDVALARRPRGEVVAADLKRGPLLSALTIEFADGSGWAFDVPKANQRAAAQVVQVLGGAVR